RLGRGQSLISSQGRTDQFPIVAREHVFIGVSRVSPSDGTLGAKACGRFDQQTAAEFVISLGCQPRQNQVTRMVEEEHPIAVRRHMSVAITAAGRLARGPYLFTAASLQTSQAPVAQDSVKIIVVLKYGS